MYFCYDCNEPIRFDDEHISKSGKHIPLDYKSRKPHKCTHTKTLQRALNLKIPNREKIISHTPINNDRLPTQRLKHFKGTEEEFKEKWK